MRKVKVKYWRLRSTVPMTPGAIGASTTFTTKCKLKYSGKWQAVASCGGWFREFYERCLYYNRLA